MYVCCDIGFRDNNDKIKKIISFPNLTKYDNLILFYVGFRDILKIPIKFLCRQANRDAIRLISKSI